MRINFFTGTENAQKWKRKGSIDGTSRESITKIQDVDLVNTKLFKYYSVWMNYNTFSIGQKGIEPRISCIKGSFAQYRKILQNQ